MQPATSNLIKDRKDICIYCSARISNWDEEFKEGVSYLISVCPEGHSNWIRNEKLENPSGLIKLILIDYARRSKLTLDSY